MSVASSKAISPASVNVITADGTTGWYPWLILFSVQLPKGIVPTLVIISVVSRAIYLGLTLNSSISNESSVLSLNPALDESPSVPSRIILSPWFCPLPSSNSIPSTINSSLVTASSRTTLSPPSNVTSSNLEFVE